MARTIQVSFNDDEMKYLEGMANEEGISVSLLIKKMVLPKGQHDEFLERILRLMKNQPSEEPFVLRDLFPASEWRSIPRNIRLSVGKEVYQLVSSGKIVGVTALDKKNNNCQVYKKN